MIKKTFSYILLVSILVVAVYFYNASPLIIERNYLAFGTNVNIKIVPTSKLSQKEVDNLFTNIKTTLETLHQKWHPWEEHPSNELLKLNAALQNGKSYTVDDDTLNILKTAKFVGANSDHLFNPALGKLFKLWGFHHENYETNRVPNEAAIKKILNKNLSMDNILINKNIISTNLNQNDRKDLQLDLNAIAKGQIILILKNILLNYEIQNALINIGGDLSVMGYKDPSTKTPWSIAIFNPFDNSPIAVIQLEANMSVATSGNYFRNFKVDDKNYHHLIHPKSGEPSKYFVQATVIYNDPLVADALATVLFLSDKDNYQKYLKRFNIQKYYLVAHDGTIIFNNS